jgi:hypothetical protein
LVYPGRFATETPTLQQRLIPFPSVSALLAISLLGGCAGYAEDYWVPKKTIVGEQLGRYGLQPEQAQCVNGRLTANLSVWQLRQLNDLAKRLVPGGQNPDVLRPWDLRYIAGLVKDPKVGAETAQALDACGAGIDTAQRAPAATEPPPAPPADGAPAAEGQTAPPPGEAAPPASAPAAATGPSLWVNLGAAATGQSIAVDASTLENAPTSRQGWFRMTDPGKPPSDTSYRLKIDCAAKTITASAARKYDAAGTLAKHEDYGPEWQSPLPIEAGTVMEIAYRALCS